MRIERVLEQLKQVSGPLPTNHGRTWKACCPSHDDSSPSLSITAHSSILSWSTDGAVFDEQGWWTGRSNRYTMTPETPT